MTFIFFSPVFGHADPHQKPLNQPTGQVLLRVQGGIQKMNRGEHALFDLDLLKALPIETIKTTMLWHKGEKRSYKGVPLKDLMKAVAAKGQTLTFYAADGYTKKISGDMIAKRNPILAYEVNGKPLREEKASFGDLKVVFDHDGMPDFQKRLDYDFDVKSVYKIEVQ